MIRLHNVTKVYANGLKALDTTNLHIAPGEIFGIIGMSGAGKSTLIRCINLLERPTTGEVMVNGRKLLDLNAAQLREAQHEIGMIFQHFNLLSSRTVFDNVGFPLEIAGVDKATIQAVVTEMLELVGLADKAGAYPSQLSGGQKQRVGIARALASKPKVLLCDEATSALDPQTTTAILKLLKEINQRLGLTIVLITHEMNVIKEICDRVAVIEGGTIIEAGKVVEVFIKPQQQTTQAFVKTVMNNDIPDEVKNRPLISMGADKQIIRITFFGEQTGHPVISAMVRECAVDFNILYGNVDHIQDTPFGILILQLNGPQAARDKAIQFLRDNGTEVEVIGHVE